MATNSMREHREKMLAIKAQKLALSQDPRISSAAIEDGVRGITETVGNETLAQTTAATMTHNIELRLYSQLNMLKDIKSIQEKIDRKSAFLPDYYGYIEGCLAISPSAQNNTLVTLMIWASDVGNMELAIRIAQYALLNEMVMPEGYTRGIAEFITEQCADAWLNHPDQCRIDTLLIEKVIELGVGEQMVDEVRAKIYKAQGLALKDTQPTDALAAFKNALRFNKNSGCKTFVTQLEKQLKTLISAGDSSIPLSPPLSKGDLKAEATRSSPDANVGSQSESSTENSDDVSTTASTDTLEAENPATGVTE